MAETKKTTDDDVKLNYYQDWTFDFKLETSKDGGCKGYVCKDVFGAFKSCSYDSHSKYRTGSLNLGCGTASYSMNPPKEDPPSKPKTELKMQNEHCYVPDEFGNHADVHEGSVTYNSGWACVGTARREQMIKAGNKDTFISFVGMDGSVTLQYNVYWKDGCELANGATAVYAANPLNKDKISNSECQDIFTNQWKSCINNGVGGSIQAGCLVYELKAQAKS